MPHYMVQAAYTPETCAALSKNPQDRFAAIRPAFEAVGGRLEQFYFCFGDYDVVLIAELPDNVAAAAVAIAAFGRGTTRAIKTTPLLSNEDGIEAMRRSGAVHFEVPA